MLVASPAFSDGARFGGSVYENSPKLGNALSLVVAGGGPKEFSTVMLFDVLAGDKAMAEEQTLTRAYGAERFGQFVKTFDYVVQDALRIEGAKASSRAPTGSAPSMAFPEVPDPSPTDGKALSAALYRDGLDPNSGFNVEYMLDHLVGHAMHVTIMNDIDAKYGEKADADYHIILSRVMRDLQALYGL